MRKRINLFSWLSLMFSLLLLMCGAMLSAQEFKFHQLTSGNILDNQSILTIAQDNENRLWFGGKDKLYVYDSQNIKNVFEDKQTSISIPYLNKIAIDPCNNIFLGTSNNLLVYNADRQQYIIDNDDNLLNATIYDIKIWKEKAIVASSKGLYVIAYDEEKDTFYIQKQITSFPTQSMSFTQESTLLYASGTNFYTKSLAHFDTPARKTTLPITGDIITTIERKDDEVWIGTYKSGIFIYKNHQFHRTITEQNSPLLSNNIRKIIKHHDDILIGTLKGVTKVNGEQQFSNFNHQPAVPWSISRNSTYDIYIDDQDIIWVGTYFGGINAVYPNASLIDNWDSQSISKYVLNSEIISSIAEDSKQIFVGTEETGLQIIEKSTGKSSNISLPSNLVKTLLVIEDQLFIGQYNGGLSILHTQTNDLQNYDLSNWFEGANTINVIEKDIHGNVFLGSNKGVFLWQDSKAQLLDETKNTDVLHLIDNKINGLYTIISGKIWFKNYDAPNFAPISQADKIPWANSISLNDDGQLWVSTDHHIFLLQNEQATLVYQDPEYVFGHTMQLDEYLWITSDKGLLRLDINRNTLHLLTVEDGLTTNSLRYSKFYKHNKEEVYLTSLKGLNVFNPNTIRLNEQPPHVLLSKFSVFNTEIILPKTQELSPTSYHIKLPHDQNFFTIEFASSNFIKPQKNRYKYLLEGFDKDWKETDVPIVRYMNLPPGDYTMWMMASNNDGLWSEQPLGLALQISPPYWKTWWAYVVYLLLFFLAIHLLIKFIVEREVLINSEKEHEKKIKFFTQISHEIRTPLTLITVPLEEIISSTRNMPALHTKSKRLKKNADKLLVMVNELLDFKKIDDGKEILKLQSVDIKKYLEEFFYLFSDLALAKRLNFFIKNLDDAGLVKIDTQQFDKALFNLLSNAVKYSQEEGTVFMEGTIKDNHYRIRIADDGIGISQNNQFKIFEEYYRDPNAEDTVGMGIGLALTKKIIEQHQSEIECVSKTIDGKIYTIFNIKIPLKNFQKRTETAAANPLVQSSNVQTIPKPELNKETLLLVEDNKELSDTIANLFAEHYETITAVDGEEGFSKARSLLPDIIISDVMMPKMNGIDMCEKIKSNILTAHIPIILLTADTNESSHISGLQYGANVYLQKPFNTTILQYTVNNLLQLATKNRNEFHIEKPNIQSEVDRQFLLQLETLINNNLLNTEFNVEYLASQIGMSAPILYKKLKALTNLSVNNFIKQQRFKRACELLKTDMTISEVAYAVGFSDRKYFSREFKKHYGINPSEYINTIIQAPKRTEKRVELVKKS